MFDDEIISDTEGAPVNEVETGEDPQDARGTLRLSISKSFLLTAMLGLLFCLKRRNKMLQNLEIWSFSV